MAVYTQTTRAWDESSVSRQRGNKGVFVRCKCSLHEECSCICVQSQWTPMTIIVNGPEIGDEYEACWYDQIEDGWWGERVCRVQTLCLKPMVKFQRPKTKLIRPIINEMATGCRDHYCKSYYACCCLLVCTVTSVTVWVGIVWRQFDKYREWPLEWVEHHLFDRDVRFAVCVLSGQFMPINAHKTYFRFTNNYNNSRREGALENGVRKWRYVLVQLFYIDGQFFLNESHFGGDIEYTWNTPPVLIKVAGLSRFTHFPPQISSIENWL